MKLSRKFRRALRSILSAVVLGLICYGIIYVMGNISSKMLRSPLESMENQVTDLAFHVRKNNDRFHQVTTNDIVIIDIDDASINALGRQQLWPRAFDARVIDYIASGNPKAIGIDFLYTEPDTLSPEYTRMLSEKGFANAATITDAMSTDHLLSQSIERSGNVYLSFFDDDANGPQIVDTSLLSSLRTFTHFNKEDYQFHTINYPVLPARDFGEKSKAVGSIAVPTMQDGTVRHYRLFQQLADSSGQPKLIANFPFYMMLDELGVNESEVNITKAGVDVGGKTIVPLRSDGSFRINWLGTEDKIRYISYYKVWDELVPAEFFENKFVFFGTSASGLQDLKTVPSIDDKMPGVEVHVQAFLNMMNAAYLNEYSEKDLRIWFALISILLVFVFLLTRPLLGFIIAVVLYFGERFIFELYVIPKYNIMFPITTLMLLTLLTYLLASLYTYFIRERRSRQMKSAFGTYVSPEIVERIAKDPGILQLGGEKKVLTVLFSDIRSFTSYSEQFDPQKIVAVLNNYLSAMSEIIFRHKGTIDKFIGDAIMAIFGAPIPQDDHADRACRVALDMIDDLKQFNIQENEKGRPALVIGIGINTGEMIVGNIGSEKRFDYTVIGDAVNIGSRLEGLTKFFGVDIIVSDFTVKVCQTDEFRFRILGSVLVKGKDEPVRVYELLRKPADAIQQQNEDIWDDAFLAFRYKDLHRASELFAKYEKARPGDKAALYYMQQCEEFKAKPDQFSLVLKMENK